MLAGRLFTHAYNSKNDEVQLQKQDQILKLTQILPRHTFDYFQTRQKCLGRSDCESFFPAMALP